MKLTQINIESLRFRESILYLTVVSDEISPRVKLRSKVETPSVFQESRIYDLFDPNEPDRIYHAIMLTKKRPKSNHISELYHGTG